MAFEPSGTMGPRLILGKDVSDGIYAELKARIQILKDAGTVPGLAVVLVGEDPASQVYVRMKGKKCEELGMRSVTIILPRETTQDELLKKVNDLNNDPKIHGFLIQLPLPDHIDEETIINAVDPKKDVDCFHPVNVGKMLIGEPDFLPATPAGVQQMLVRSGIETKGKHVVVVGRSNIVGKPMAAMMIQKGIGADSTVTVVHSRTTDLPSITRQADILIVAIGKPLFVTADMVKDGAVVIDVGTNRIDDPTSSSGSKLVGDVDIDGVRDKVSAISPVPGGVGPMTICMLMANTVTAAEKTANGVLR
ncbi:MAG: bifunctional methylenetetrahydrofolate dehydrogenase/methenyltetrahydrofolate cyclohydrolase FolD [Candidatus Methanoplasma sp.]|nr:bifunctional methylenetetrahydrofolate dehydrogenase/methenyltetrahydrofolate cyclohydrolase FolD [Candidatus Methanoplasma sp.]